MNNMNINNKHDNYDIYQIIQIIKNYLYSLSLGYLNFLKKVNVTYYLLIFTLIFSIMSFRLMMHFESFLRYDHNNTRGYEYFRDMGATGDAKDGVAYEYYNLNKFFKDGKTFQQIDKNTVNRSINPYSPPIPQVGTSLISGKKIDSTKVIKYSGMYAWTEEDIEKHEQYEEQYDDVVNPLEEHKDREIYLKRGKIIYNRTCFICHGPIDKPEKGVLSSYNGFNNVQKIHKLATAKETGALFFAISSGHGTMPGYIRILSENDRWSVILYMHDYMRKHYWNK